MSDSTKPKVIIFNDHLLYPSETFIHAQVSALSRFSPVYAGSRRVEGLDLQGEQVHVLNHGNLWGRCRELRFKLLGHAPGLMKKLDALHPVLVHAHYGPNGLRALPIAKYLKVPLIVTFHGSDVTLRDLRYQKTTLGFRHYVANIARLRKSDAQFLVISKFIRRKLLDQGFPEQRVLVHYTGVDTRKFHPASIESSPMILFVGRLVESKGVEYLIRAAAEVQKQLPDAELVLLGDGPLRVDLERLAKQSLRRYRFLGTRPSTEVCEWMNRASVVCVPSITRRSGEEEGFGMVCAEAQAVGKPVVAFASGGISEVICHAKTGFLTAERDWQSLANYLSVLLQDAKLREQFGSAGRQWVLQEFALEHRTKILEGIYARVSGMDGATEVKEEEHGSILQSNSIHHSDLRPAV